MGNGKNYPSIEIIIRLSDLFGITIDELLRGDEELKEKVIQDGKRLAYPKWKLSFDCIFLLGLFLFMAKLIILGLNKIFGVEITILESMSKSIYSFLPLILMLSGGIGSDILGKKYAGGK